MGATVRLLSRILAVITCLIIATSVAHPAHAAPLANKIEEVNWVESGLKTIEGKPVFYGDNIRRTSLAITGWCQRKHLGKKKGMFEEGMSPEGADRISKDSAADLRTFALEYLPESDPRIEDLKNPDSDPTEIISASDVCAMRSSDESSVARDVGDGAAQVGEETIESAKDDYANEAKESSVKAIETMMGLVTGMWLSETFSTRVVEVNPLSSEGYCEGPEEGPGVHGVVAGECYAPWDPLQEMGTVLHPVILTVLALSICLGAMRIALTQSSQGLLQILRALANTVVVSSLVAILTQALILMTDGITKEILEAAPGSDDEGLQNAAQIMGMNGESLAEANVLSFIVLILLAVLIVCAAVAQLGLMLFRMAAIPAVLMFAPVAAAASSTEVGTQWLKKSLMWLVSFVIYKPVAAAIFTLGLHVLSFQASDQQLATEEAWTSIVRIIAAFILLVLCVVAMPAIMKALVPLASAGVSSAFSGGAVAAGAVAGAVAVGSLAASGGASGAAGAAGTAANGKPTGSTEPLPGGPNGGPNGGSGSGDGGVGASPEAPEGSAPPLNGGDGGSDDTPAALTSPGGSPELEGGGAQDSGSPSGNGSGAQNSGSPSGNGSGAGQGAQPLPGGAGDAAPASSGSKSPSGSKPSAGSGTTGTGSSNGSAPGSGSSASGGGSPDGAAPGGGAPGGDGSAPVTDGAAPAGGDSAPVTDGAAPGGDGSAPVTDGAAPAGGGAAGGGREGPGMASRVKSAADNAALVRGALPQTPRLDEE